MSSRPKEFGIRRETPPETPPVLNEESLNNLGARRQLEGDLAGAREAYRLALETEKDNPTTLNNLGYTYAQEGKWQEAIDLYRQALQSEPTHGTSWMNLGCALVMQGENGEALQALLQAVKFSPDNPTLWENLGRLLLLGGQADQAEVALRRAMNLAPESVELAIPLSNALVAQGQLSDAIETVKIALAQDDQQGELWKQLGVLCFLFQDLGSASSALHHAVALLPGDTEARHHLATTLFALGHTEQGVRELERILTLKPYHVPARTDLAVVALSQGRRDVAEAHLALAAKSQPDQPRIRYYQALILAHKGETAKSTPIFAELAETEGKYAEMARQQLAISGS